LQKVVNASPSTDQHFSKEGKFFEIYEEESQSHQMAEAQQESMT